jgi:hypothetical protein
MDFLPLDDPRWRELEHRGWSNGCRCHLDPTAPFVPDELAKLAVDPSDFERLSSLWPYLCSEGTTWAAAYGAVPYFVDFARRLPAEQRAEYLIVLGLIVVHSCAEAGTSFEIKTFVERPYRRAVSDAFSLLMETLAVETDTAKLRYLLGSAAALRGHLRLAAVLQDLDAVYGDCPKCGESVYPQELQEASK